MSKQPSTPGDRTPWFSGTVTPVREGVYQRDMSNFNRPAGRWSYWTGKFWGGWGGDPLTAEKNKAYESCVQDVPWRGLTKEPK